MFEIEILR